MRSAVFMAILTVFGWGQSELDTNRAHGQAPPGSAEIWAKYEKLIDKHPDVPLLRYNLGNLAYGLGDYSTASDQYHIALPNTTDTTRSKVYYNMGNSAFRAGKIEESLACYREAVKLNPADDDARLNYEFVKRLASQKQDRQQDQKQNSDSDTADNKQQKESQEKDGQQDQDSRSGEKEEGKKGDTAEEAQSDQEDGSEDQQRSKGSELKKEEAEAILNALKADEANLMKRIYTPAESVTLEKDW